MPIKTKMLYLYTYTRMAKRSKVSTKSWYIYICIHIHIHILKYMWGFPGGSDGKASACNAGDLGLIPGLGRSPGEEMASHSSTLAWKIP